MKRCGPSWQCQAPYMHNLGSLCFYRGCSLLEFSVHNTIVYRVSLFDLFTPVLSVLWACLYMSVHDCTCLYMTVLSVLSVFWTCIQQMLPIFQTNEQKIYRGYEAHLFFTKVSRLRYIVIELQYIYYKENFSEYIFILYVESS